MLNEEDDFTDSDGNYETDVTKGSPQLMSKKLAGDTRTTL